METTRKWGEMGNFWETIRVRKWVVVRLRLVSPLKYLGRNRVRNRKSLGVSSVKKDVFLVERKSCILRCLFLISCPGPSQATLCCSLKTFSCRGSGYKVCVWFVFFDSFLFPCRCFSSVGMKYWVTGSQTISLGSGCNHRGVAMHEMMHAIGFWHEQSRYDRDQYVEIMWENIEPGN